jgi:hypothetical protein
MRTEPPVSVPTEAMAMPSATAAAEPPLDPPADRAVSAGWRTAPNAESSLVVPNAYSCRFVLPTITAPARRSRPVTTASAATGSFDATCDPAVVGTPAWSIRSFSAMGIPCSGPRSWPPASSASACRASARAASAVTAIKARRASLRASMRARHASASASDDSDRARSLRPASTMSSEAMSTPTIVLVIGGRAGELVRRLMPVRGAQARGRGRQAVEQRLERVEAAAFRVGDRPRLPLVE